MSIVEQELAGKGQAGYGLQGILEFLNRHGINRKVLMDIGMAVEMAIIVVSAIVAKLLYIDVYLAQESADTASYAGVGFMGALVCAVTLHKQKLYDAELFGTQSGHVRRFFIGLLIGFLIVGAVGYVVKVSSDYSRGWAITWFLLSLTLLVLERKLAVRLIGGLFERGAFAKRVVLVGAGAPLEAIQRQLADTPAGMVVAGVYNYDTHAVVNQSALLEQITSGVRLSGADEVILALPLSSEKEIASAVLKFSQMPVGISLYPGEFSTAASVKSIRTLGATRLLALQTRPIDDWGRIFKSLFDRISSLALLVMLSPVLSLICLAIKLDSKGPVFFRQKRRGLNHKVIDVWKFRTMKVMEDGENVVQATTNDPRITRLGRLLRKTSLDELPQLWNVLKGEMSLVGPRPHAMVHDEYYGELIEEYANRHKVKPGITGLAQISGFRGETQTPDLMRRRVDCDLYYIENWSLATDMEILIKTTVKGFVSAQAY